VLATLFNAPLWVFVICLFGAIFTWLAADQFRDQLLADSHRLVREVAIRYLQITIGLFTIFIIGMFWAVGRYATQSIQGLLGAPDPEMVESPTITPTVDPFFGPIGTPTSPNSPAQSSDAGFAPTGDASPTPTEVPTANVFNTQGLGVNMREAAGFDGAIVIVVAEGDSVILLGEREEADGLLWYHVQTQTGIQGWIADLYLDLGE
jgi:hypothetical protein